MTILAREMRHIGENESSPSRLTASKWVRLTGGILSWLFVSELS